MSEFLTVLLLMKELPLLKVRVNKPRRKRDDDILSAYHRHGLDC
jgi:hypothetical protein